MWDDVPPGDVEPPHLAHEWAALTADEQREVEAWFAARKGSCPACLGAMPAHQMGLPLQEAHRSHVEGRDV